MAIPPFTGYFPTTEFRLPASLWEKNSEQFSSQLSQEDRHDLEVLEELTQLLENDDFINDPKEYTKAWSIREKSSLAELDALALVRKDMGLPTERSPGTERPKLTWQGPERAASD